MGLVSLGVSRGDRIAILAGNCVEWLLVDWANICIGALSVPIYASSSGSQAVHIIGHSDPAVLIVDSMRRLEKLDFARTTLSGFKTTVHFAEEKIEGDQRLPGKTLSIGNLREMGRAYETCHPGVFEGLVESLLPQNDLTIIYTSGTTGVPKGVLSTHTNYLFMIQAVDAAVPSTDRDVAMHFLPTAHSFGRLEHFMAVAKGWTLGVARSSKRFRATCERFARVYCFPCRGFMRVLIIAFAIVSNRRAGGAGKCMNGVWRGENSALSLTSKIGVRTGAALWVSTSSIVGCLPGCARPLAAVSAWQSPAARRCQPSSRSIFGYRHPYSRRLWLDRDFDGVPCESLG